MVCGFIRHTSESLSCDALVSLCSRHIKPPRVLLAFHRDFPSLLSFVALSLRIYYHLELFQTKSRHCQSGKSFKSSNTRLRIPLFITHLYIIFTLHREKSKAFLKQIFYVWETFFSFKSKKFSVSFSAVIKSCCENFYCKSPWKKLIQSSFYSSRNVHQTPISRRYFQWRNPVEFCIFCKTGVTMEAKEGKKEKRCPTISFEPGSRWYANKSRIPATAH